MSEISVSLEDVSKFYKLYNSPKDRLKEALHPFGRKLHREFYALKHLNLEVKKGEILGIVGRNGAGKSTLLKLISGVIQPASGKIIVNGTVSAMLELGSGLHPDFTGMQNIYFSGTMMGFTRNEMTEKIDAIVDFAEIGDFIHQPLKTYSSGMKARLGFALAINMAPKILILDEVLSVGDELFKRKCYAKMEEFFKSDCTVLFVSHSINSINEICTRAIFLEQGELLLEGSPKLVTMHYQRYMYAGLKIKKETLEEIQQLNKREDIKEAFISKPEVISNTTDIPEKLVEKSEENNLTYSPFFVENFTPKSTVITKHSDIDIYDFHINTLDGKEVNVLLTNEKYIYSYKVRFNVPAENVKFGIGVNTEKGFFLGGKVHQHTLERIEEGEEFLVEWNFHCNFLDGNYYLGVGIKSMIEDKEIILHRINDATVFKVQKVPEALCAGTVSFIRNSNVTPIRI